MIAACGGEVGMIGVRQRKKGDRAGKMECQRDG